MVDEATFDALKKQVECGVDGHAFMFQKVGSWKTSLNRWGGDYIYWSSKDKKSGLFKCSKCGITTVRKLTDAEKAAVKKLFKN